MIKNNNEHIPLQNTQTSGGNYKLIFIDAAGNKTQVKKIGYSIKPFEFITDFPGTNYIAVKKYIKYQKELIIGRLYLVNKKTGKIPSVMVNGTKQIKYIPQTHDLFFAPIMPAGKEIESYNWQMSPGTAPSQTINIPYNQCQRIQSATTGTPIAIITIEKKAPEKSSAAQIATVAVIVEKPKKKRERPKTVKSKQTRRTKKRATNWRKSTDKTLRLMYYYYRKKGKNIPKGLNKELGRRFAGYDTVTQTFGHKNIREKATMESTVAAATKRSASTTKRTDFSQSSDTQLRSLHNYYHKQNRQIPDALNAELKRRFARYDAATQTFGHKPAKAVVATKTSVASKPAHSANETTIVSISVKPQLDVVDRKQNAATKIERPAPSPIAKTTQPPPIPQTIKPAVVTPAAAPAPVVRPQSKAPTQLSVTLKPVKETLDGIYNDVYVNGTRILRNHVDTEIKTFLDGTILGIHGIVTTDANLPQRPIWMIFDTNLTANKWIGKDKFSGYSVYVSKLSEHPDMLRLYASNRVQILLDFEKYKRLAAGRMFKLVPEKTK